MMRVALQERQAMALKEILGRYGRSRSASRCSHLSAMIHRELRREGDRRAER
jgi:hypothetical protein